LVASIPSSIFKRSGQRIVRDKHLLYRLLFKILVIL